MLSEKQKNIIDSMDVKHQKMLLKREKIRYGKIKKIIENGYYRIMKKGNTTYKCDCRPNKDYYDNQAKVLIDIIEYINGL